MTTSLLSRMQIDRNLRRSTERIEIVPQETCVHHESPDTLLSESVNPSTHSTTVPKEVSPRRASEAPGISANNK